MAQAAKGDTVKVHYTGRLADGSVFDSSCDRDPLEFTTGADQVIPGFEDGVLGMSPGESKTITIPADQAYGQHRDELTAVFDRNQFPPDLHPEVGQQLQLQGENGEPIVVQITNVTDTAVTLDANHPLAGKDLIFDLQLVAIE